MSAIIFPICSANADELLVSAASSLTDAFTEIGKSYSAANPSSTVRFNFAASGTLQQQILQGAPVDIFASASTVEMDYLERAHRIAIAGRTIFATNRLVLIAPSGSGIRNWNDLKEPQIHRVALSDPDSVPSGRYARECLQKRNLWQVVQPKAVFGENVRQTLTYVSSGNVDAGIVFATDAQSEGRRVRVVQTAVPGNDHAPILYPVAAVLGAPNPVGAQRFIAFLRGPVSQRTLSRFGFLPPVTPNLRRSSGLVANPQASSAKSKSHH